MHETLIQPGARATQNSATQYHSNPSVRGIPQAPKAAPPNRSLSTTKHVGNVQIKVILPNMTKPIVFSGHPVKQYTRLPDHRPPLRRDKPVRISLPDHAARYIFPAVERSFIFIPRAMRPNQQGYNMRGKGRSGLGSYGGYSRRTSIYGGSMYGSGYTPSVAMSRRSSLAHEVARDNIASPVGSTTSRPPIPIDTSRPVVRLPPAVQPGPPSAVHHASLPNVNGALHIDGAGDSQLPQHNHALPQDPTFRENRPGSIPMHQPRPQKTVSVADIESPATLSFNPPQQQQQPFHQQVPVQVNGTGYAQESTHTVHARNPSFPGHVSTGTPLSQIPERAIHAQPFQPNHYQPQQGFYPQQYQVTPAQQGYYYPSNYNTTMPQPTAASTYAAPPPQQPTFTQSVPADPALQAQAGAPNLVAQEVNGMVYYYDATQIPAVATFPAYTAPPSYPAQQVGGVVGMGGMMTPSPDGFYYPQPAPGVMYYPQQ
jgi:hypothetical protein